MGKIVIVTSNPFPVGLAGTNRILAYGRGFIHHGYQLEVICIRPTEPYYNVINKQKSGLFGGIVYSYPGRTNVRVKSFLGRRLNDISALISSLGLFIRLLGGKEISFSIFYGTNLFTEILFLSISRLFGNNIYKEESENPQVYFRENRSLFNKPVEWFYINYLYRSYKGLLVMTRPLKDFFLAKGIQERKILIVPQTVELERFEKRVKSFSIPLPEVYIAYVGSLNHEKDGVLTLVESFADVSAIYPEIHLVLAGEGSIQEKEALSQLINQLGQIDKIHYIGRISSSEIPGLLNGAKLLVSCRPESIQSNFGFPTKIAEFLSSGIPTVTTATGELASFLADRENAFVVDKSEPGMVVIKIIEVLKEYDFALKVAKNGQNLVRDKFNPINQAKLIIEFCQG